LAVFFVLLTAGSPYLSAQAQTQDDHNDSGPVQAGYAIVTPSFGTPGVSVSETFGLRQQGSAIQTSLDAQPLVLSALMFVNESVRLSKDIGIAIVNPNNGVASVILTVRKNDGTQLQTKTIQIATRRQTIQFLTELFTGLTLPTEFTGTVQIDTTTPVAVTGIRFRDDNFSVIPVVPFITFGGTVPTLSIGIGGSGSALLPIFLAGGGWASEIMIMNSNAASVTVRLDLFKEDGSGLTTALNGQTVVSSITNITVPAHGIVVYAPRNRNGDDDF